MFKLRMQWQIPTPHGSLVTVWYKVTLSFDRNDARLPSMGNISLIVFSFPDSVALPTISGPAIWAAN